MSNELKIPPDNIKILLTDNRRSRQNTPGFARHRLHIQLEDLCHHLTGRHLQTAVVIGEAIYHHFGSKSDLPIPLIEDTATEDNTVINQAVIVGGSFLNAFKRILVYTFNVLEEDRLF